MFVFILFAITDASSSHLWLKQTGLAAWTQQAAFFGIVAVPVGLLMIGGEFDLSAGVMTGVTAIVMALLVGKWHVDTWLAIIITLAFATAIGLINGYVVVLTKLPSFIVTLATFFVLRGASTGGVLLLNSGSTQIVGDHPHPPGLSSAKSIFGSSFFSSGSLPSGYSTAILWFIAVTIVGTWVLSRTTFGNWIFASGGDQNAARNVGRAGQPDQGPAVRRHRAGGGAGGDHLVHPGVLGGVRAGRRLRVLLHHRGGGRRLPADRRLRLGDRRGARRLHHRHGVRRRHLRGLGQLVELRVPGAILFLAVVVNTLIYRRALRARR